MSRSVGLTELFTDVPAIVVVSFAVVTQLGDVWFVSTVALLAYWLGSATPYLGRGLTRERGGMVVALCTTALVVALSLKTLFAFPRPPGAGVATDVPLLSGTAQSLYVSAATGEGYGFPSGHATTTVLVWGGLAWAVRVGTARVRYGIAGAVVGVVSLSRLVLGVHYLVDVAVGVAIAGTVLWLSVTRLERPEWVFAFSALFAVAGIVASGLTRESAAVLGMSVGGVVAWRSLGTLSEPTPRGGVATTVLGAALLGSVAVAVLTLTPSEPVVGLLSALAMGGALALPPVGERVAKKKRSW